MKVPPAPPARRRPVINAWRRRFIARIAAVTATIQAPAVLLAAALLRPHLGWPAALGLSIAAHVAAALVGLRRLVFWVDDARDPPWRTYGLEVPWVAYTTASFLMMPFTYLALAALGLSRLAGWHAPGLVATLGPILAAGAALGLWSVTAGRALPEVRTREVALPGLPEAFDGYRVVQLSDVHCGPFLPRWLLRAWCARALAQRPDVVVLTGDYITAGNGYLDDVAELAARTRCPGGVFACLGNHDYFALDGRGDDQVARALERGGARVLRNEHVRLERGGGAIALAGIDDRWTRRDDVAAALRGVRDGDFVVMLAHDPASFPEIAARGVGLVLAGHTHAGQFALPLGDRVNLARWAHRYTQGLYRERGSALYVHRGMGTSGPPARFGARPEVAVLVLRAAPAPASASS